MAVNRPGYSEVSAVLLGSAYAAAVYHWIGDLEPGVPFTGTELVQATRIPQATIGMTLKKLIRLEEPLIERVPTPRYYRTKPYVRTDHPMWPDLHHLSYVILWGNVDLSSLEMDHPEGS